MKRILRAGSPVVVLAVVAAFAVAGAPAIAATDPGPVLGAPAAPASVALTAARALETDLFVIEGNGFDVGGSGFAAGVPTDSAIVDWDEYSQETLGARVSGWIHFDGVTGSCARVRLITYDAWGGELSREYSDEECAYSDGHVERPFSFAVDNLLSELKVTLQTLAVNGTWGNVGSQTMTAGPTFDTDEVSISRAEFDLGTGAFVGGTAADPAIVTWAIEPGPQFARIAPSFSGTLYMRNADDLCGRVQAKYIRSDGSEFFTQTSDEHCVTNDELHTFPVALGIGMCYCQQVKYVIQSKDNTGEWSLVGSTIVELN